MHHTKLFWILIGAMAFAAVPANAQQAPAITSASAASFPAGIVDYFTVTTTGVPTPAITESRVRRQSRRHRYLERHRRRTRLLQYRDHGRQWCGFQRRSGLFPVGREIRLEHRFVVERDFIYLRSIHDLYGDGHFGIGRSVRHRKILR